MKCPFQNGSAKSLIPSFFLVQEIKDYYFNLGEDKHSDLLHLDFKRAINAIKVDFVKDEGVLRVLTRDDSSQRRAGMLQEMHFR